MNANFISSYVDTSCWTVVACLARWLRALVLPKCEFDPFNQVAFCDVFVDTDKKVGKQKTKKQKRGQKNGEEWKQCIWDKDATKGTKKSDDTNKTPRGGEFKKETEAARQRCEAAWLQN